jgi:hypothetical protein
VNGESSVHIDRGRWLYRFALDTDNIAIYRARRAGQGFAPAEVWRCLAVLGVSDAFIVPVPGGWQPFVELGEGRQRWALEKRSSMDAAEAATRHFLVSLADAVVQAAQAKGLLGDKDPDPAKTLRAPEPGAPPGEDVTVEAVLSQAKSARDSAGWELIYSRQRASR